MTHQLPACCSSAVAPLHKRRNRDAVVVANAEAWIACTLVLAYDAESCLVMYRKKVTLACFGVVGRSMLGSKFP